MASKAPLLSEADKLDLDPKSGNGASTVTFDDDKNRHGSTGSTGRPTTDSWGSFNDTMRNGTSDAPGGSDDPNAVGFLQFRKDLEHTARRISQKRVEALQADVDNCHAKSSRNLLGENSESGKPPVRRSRTEAAQSASEAGVNVSTLAADQKMDRSKLRRRSIIKQDATLEYFRDRRPNKHSGYRRAITNNQNVFSMRWKTVGLLFLVGTLTGMVHYVVAWVENLILESKQNLAQAVSDRYSWEVSFIVWWCFTVTVMLISLTLTQKISPVAAGSGIPQMKTELTGHKIKNYLSLRTLAAKIVGLTTAVGAGMYIGQEGPFVHIASALAHGLIYMKAFKGPFKRIRENKSVQLAVLEAACAVGVSSTFRAPIGGVLFSIEVTSTYYMVANYWKGFLAAISASFMSHVIDMISTRDVSATFDPLFYVDYDTNKTYEYWEVCFFLAIGVFLGFCGAMVVKLNAKMSKLKSKMMKGQSTLNKEILWTMAVGTLTASCYLFGKFSIRSYKKNIQDLVDPTSLLVHHKESSTNGTLVYNDAWEGPDWVQDWGDLKVIFPLFCFFVSNFILVALSLTVSVPCGCFVPLFAGGAAFGRLVGELVQYYITSQNPDYNSLPGGYALVGAAAFTAGGTRTVSVAVIAMELTGELDFILPIFIGVFASCITGSRFSDSIYDSILKARNLPYLANVVLKPNAVVADIMTPVVPCLSKVCTTKDMLIVLREKFEYDIPIVESKETMLLHGTVCRSDVEHVVRQIYAENKLENVSADLGQEKSNNIITSHEKERKRGILLQSHDLLHHREVHVQAAPFILQGQTPAEDVHIIFTMLKCMNVFVTSYGMLVGVVTKENIFKANMDETEHAMDIYSSLRPVRRGGRRGSIKQQDGFIGLFPSDTASPASSERSTVPLASPVEGSS